MNLKNNFFYAAFFSFSLILFFAISFNLKASKLEKEYEQPSSVFGITSLMSAVVNSDIEAVKFFVKANKAQINQQNIGGATALHIAARNNNKEILQILIDNSADLNIVDNDGYSALMRAVISDNYEIAEILLKKNIDVKLKNNNDDSALVLAVSSLCNQCLPLLFDKFSIKNNDEINDFKDELIKSYKIAQSSNNFVAQNLLQERLDDISKLEILLQEAKIVDEKKYVIIEDALPDAPKQDVAEPVFIIPDAEIRKNVIMPFPTSNQSSLKTKNIITRFKFLPGAHGEKICECEKKADKSMILKKPAPKKDNISVKKYYLKKDFIVNKNINPKSVDFKFISGEQTLPLVAISDKVDKDVKFNFKPSAEKSFDKKIKNKYSFEKEEKIFIDSNYNQSEDSDIRPIIIEKDF